MIKIRALLIAGLAGPWACGGAASAEQIVAVFSSETGPYQEALKGLEQNLETDTILPLFLSQGEPKIPASPRVVVTFGSKAALRRYPGHPVLIYAMAPGTLIDGPDAIKICMEPEAAILLLNLKNIQPGLKRLGVFWQSSRFKGYIEELRKTAAPMNISIESALLERNADVPGHLRGMYGRIDAIWLPADPLLLNAESLAVFMEFSRSSHIPLFVPTGGLVEQGAVASVGPSFREIGRMSGLVAHKALEGQEQEDNLYPTHVEILINKKAAAQAGLHISEEVLRKADRIIP